MPLLHTDLQEGFSGDEVVLQVGGREVFHQSGVRTRRQIGLAATYEEQIAAGPVVVSIALPARRLAQEVRLTLSQDTYLGVSVGPDGKIRHVVSQEPFGYM